MPHNPRHGADPGVIIGGGSGSSAPPSPPPPNNPMGFFGSMYTTPDPGNVDTSASGTSEEADKNIDIILGQGYSGGQGTGGQDTSGSGTDTGTKDTGTKDTGTKDEDDKGTGIQDEKIQDFLFGTTGDPTANIKDFQESGKHPLRAQLDYLRFKYGDSFLDTEQAQVLMGYLSGVPVERGGGLGARDQSSIGETNVEDIPAYDPITGEYRSPEERQELADAAKYREDTLDNFSNLGVGVDGDSFSADYLKNLDINLLRLGLSPDQYFDYRQQLMAADPTPENQLYKDAFPFSSGSGLGALAENFMPGATALSGLIGGIFPERNLTGYQQNEDPFAAGFEPLPVERDEGIMRTNVANRYQTGNPTDPTNPTNPTDPNPTLPITTPQIPTSRFPDSVIRDYTQLGLPNIYGNQQMPNYATFNRAGPMPVGLQNYLDTLRNRFGIA
jgi:hypothetical protein